MCKAWARATRSGGARLPLRGKRRPMRETHRLVVASSLLVVWLAASCGGGGYGGGGGSHPSKLLLEASLLGSNETSVVDAAARGTALLELKDDGTLAFATTGDASWAADVTGLAGHYGFAGVNGPPSVDLLSGGATFDPATRTAEDTLQIGRTLAGQILSRPDYYYVNVTTASAPQGLARAQ